MVVVLLVVGVVGVEAGEGRIPNGGVLDVWELCLGRLESLNGFVLGTLIAE